MGEVQENCDPARNQEEEGNEKRESPRNSGRVGIYDYRPKMVVTFGATRNYNSGNTVSTMTILIICMQSNAKVRPITALLLNSSAFQYKNYADKNYFPLRMISLSHI